MIYPKQHGVLVAEFCLNLESVLTGMCQDEIEPWAGQGSLDKTLGGPQSWRAAPLLL